MAISFTEELRAAAGDQWERIINHTFTQQLAKGEIDKGGESLTDKKKSVYIVYLE